VLAEVIRANDVQELIVYSGNKNLVTVLKSVAQSCGIKIQTQSVKNNSLKVASRSKVKNLSPRLILAVLALMTQMKVSLLLRSKQPVMNNAGQVSFFDYWYRFSDSVTKSREFSSQYWSKLVSDLASTQTNWHHNLVDQHTRSELKSARALLSDFNSHEKQQNIHRHQIIDAKLNLAIVLSTLSSYLKVFWKSFRAAKYRPAFTDPNSGVNFWPLLKKEWLNSHRGYECLISCLRFYRLNSVLSTLPKQRVGFYLIENQPWEMALIHFWRKYQHGELIGVAHSTIRFWDLRLMSDPKRFLPNSTMPRPDKIAVNGSLAKHSLINSGYPIDEIIDVEALMYLHLKDVNSVRPNNRKTKILVATDYLKSATDAQMKLLYELVAKESNKFEILLKPHWSQSLDDLEIDAEIVSGKKDLASFFDQVDVLYCSAITSAVIDGVCAGVPVIQCLDPLSFNLSPLRNSASIQTVRTTSELADALTNLEMHRPEVRADELFNLDSTLSRWHTLIQI
jgi:surface carbohydrate biosynthesis protein (TIGR04326 family)